MRYGIELLSKDRIRIGPKDYRFYSYEPPLNNGTTSGIEVAGRPVSGYQELFEIEYLAGITANQLPKGFAISIYEPRLNTKRIGSLEIRNSYGVPTLTFSVSHDYADWTDSSNLIHYSSKLASEFLKSITNCVEASSKADDVCVNIWCKLDVPPTAELFEYVTNLDARIGEIIKSSKSERTELQAKEAPPLKPDEHGYKWWLRYVLTPILGSAALLALIKWLL